MNSIDFLIKKYEGEYIDFFKDIHKNPELSMCEFNTTQMIIEKLKKIKNVRFKKCEKLETGVIAWITGKKKSHKKTKTILIRTEIDALPINEKTNLKYKSKNENIMHACGHDGHIAFTLLTINVLSEIVDQFAGVVKFIFQPGEEIGKGAKEIIKYDKVLKDVDAVLACHSWPKAKTNHIVICNDVPFGYYSRFNLKIEGKSGHGSWPESSIDPISIANLIYTNFQHIISRKIPSEHSKALSVCGIQSGPEYLYNIIPKTCEMIGTIRASDINIIKNIIKNMKLEANYITKANGAKSKFVYHISNAVRNDKSLVNLMYKTAIQLFGKNRVNIDYGEHLGADNFCEFTNKVKGIYIFAGIKSKKNILDLHSDKFVFDTKIIKTVGLLYTHFVLEFLNN